MKLKLNRSIKYDSIVSQIELNTNRELDVRN
jgi:hypothetical protein